MFILHFLSVLLESLDSLILIPESVELETIKYSDHPEIASEL